MPITIFPFLFSSLFLWRYFLEHFKVHKKIEKKAHRSIPCALCPDTCIAFRMTGISQQVVRLSQLMSLHWHTHSLWLTLGVTLAVVHCVHLDKRILTCVNHHSIIQGIFRALKMFSLLPVHSYLSPALQTFGNHWLFYCFFSFAFPRMSQSWNHTVSSLFRLASYT